MRGAAADDENGASNARCDDRFERACYTEQWTRRQALGENPNPKIRRNGYGRIGDGSVEIFIVFHRGFTSAGERCMHEDTP